MSNVKKTIRNPKNKNQDDNLTELQNDIKNSIKNLYISDQKKKKTINEYAELLTKIRNEYRNHFQNMPQKLYQKPSYTKPIRKRKHYYYDEPEESEESDSYVIEIRRRPKKQKRG